MFLSYPSAKLYPQDTQRRYELFFIADETIWKLTADSLQDALAGKFYVSRHLFFQGGVSGLSVSPDGSYIAFIGSIENRYDVYVMHANGSNPIRCTYLNSPLMKILDWDEDRIMFASTHQSPAGFRDFSSYYTIFDNGQSVIAKHDGENVLGNAVLMDYGNASAVTQNEYYVVVQRYGYGYAVWKQYQGGTAGQLWLKNAKDDNKNFDHIIMSKYNCVCPTLLPNSKTLYFLSDQDGVGNVYAYTYTDKKVKQITHHTDYCAQDLSTDGVNLYYRKGADLFVYDIANQTDHQLQIDIKAHTPQTMTRFAYEDDVYEADYLSALSEYDLNEDGSKLSVTLRGQLWTMPLYVANAVQAEGFAYSLSAYMGKQMICVKTGVKDVLVLLDEKGKYLETFDENLEFIAPKEYKLQDFGCVVSLTACEKKVAIVNNTGELMILDIQTKQVRLILERKQYMPIDVSWCGDGRYLAVSDRLKGGTGSVQGVSIIDTNQITENNTYNKHDLPTELRDMCPVFDSTGKYLYFLSNRSMNVGMDSVHCQLIFDKTIKPYVVCLQKDAPNPFRGWLNLKNNEEEDNEETDEKEAIENTENATDNKDNATEKKAESKKALPDIDFDNIDKRIIAFPVEAGDYIGLYSYAGGIMWLKESGHMIKNKKKVSNLVLEKFCFDTQKVEPLGEQIIDIRQSFDKKMMAVLVGENIRVIESGGSLLAPSNGPAWKQEGIIDWSRINLQVNPQEEYKVIFQQAFAYAKALFQHQDNRQIEWEKIYEKYVVLLEKVSCRNDLNRIIAEMQGELRTSHSYIINAGDVRALPTIQQGYLGALYKITENEAYEITKIMYGRVWSSNPMEYSPLSQCSIGDTIIAIAGRKLSSKLTPEMALQNTNMQFIELEIMRKGQTVSENIYVRPIASEAMLQYLEYVQNNKKIIAEKTQDKVGYMHIPNMGNDGYVQFCRDYFSQYNKEVLIVDFRNNGGGYVSPMIVDILSRKRNGRIVTNCEVSEEPVEACTGKLVFLCNESSGSDGDIFAHQVKALGLGVLIGTRTWGGVVGIFVRNYFIDGGLASQPEYAIIFDTGPEIENHGVDPDIVVYNTLSDVHNKQDKQLERAIQEAVKMLL